MKKKRKRYQTVQPTPEPAPEPEKMIPITAGRVQVGDMVKRKPITFSDSDRKDAGWMIGRVVWIYPLGRFHVVEFGGGLELARHRLDEMLVDQAAVSYKAHAEAVKKIKARIAELYKMQGGDT